VTHVTDEIADIVATIEAKETERPVVCAQYEK